MCFLTYLSILTVLSPWYVVLFSRGSLSLPPSSSLLLPYPPSCPGFEYSTPPNFVPMLQPLCFYFPSLSFSGILIASILYVHLCETYKVAIKPGKIHNSLFFKDWTPLITSSGLYRFVQWKLKLKISYMRQSITDSFAGIDRNSIALYAL